MTLQWEHQGHFCGLSTSGFALVNLTGTTAADALPLDVFVSFDRVTSFNAVVYVAMVTCDNGNYSVVDCQEATQFGCCPTFYTPGSGSDPGLHCLAPCTHGDKDGLIAARKEVPHGATGAWLTAMAPVFYVSFYTATLGGSQVSAARRIANVEVSWSGAV